jgi:hypothetical protein
MDVCQTQEAERQHTEDEAIGDFLCPAHRFRVASFGHSGLFLARKTKHGWNGRTRRPVRCCGLGCCSEFVVSVGRRHRNPDLGHTSARHRGPGI